MKKDQVNTNLSEVVETVSSDPIDVRSYRTGLTQIAIELVDVNGNATSPTIDVTAETSLDGEVWQEVEFDSGEKTASAPATAFSPLLGTDEALGMYLRFVATVGGSGYETEAEDPDDNVYWNVEIKTILQD